MVCTARFKSSSPFIMNAFVIRAVYNGRFFLLSPPLALSKGQNGSKIKWGVNGVENPQLPTTPQLALITVQFASVRLPALTRHEAEVVVADNTAQGRGCCPPSSTKCCSCPHCPSHDSPNVLREGFVSQQIVSVAIMGRYVCICTCVCVCVDVFCMNMGQGLF